MSDASHLTSYVKITSPPPLIASGTALAVPPHVVSGVSAPFHVPLYACFTEEGSTSKPTMREPCARPTRRILARTARSGRSSTSGAS